MLISPFYSEEALIYIQYQRDINESFRYFLFEVLTPLRT